MAKQGASARKSDVKGAEGFSLGADTRTSQVDLVVGPLALSFISPQPSKAVVAAALLSKKQAN